METLEKSYMCRLCGKHSEIPIDIFDKSESHMRKINAILPILVHEMDLLPKQMCHRCSYKLEEFYNFYINCAKTDTEFKSQLSWMSKENFQEKIVTPMVKMNKFKIKANPLDKNDAIDSCNILGQIGENSTLFPARVPQINFNENTDFTFFCVNCRCECNKSILCNKDFAKQEKDVRNIESENKMSSSTVVSNISDKVSQLNKLKTINTNFSFDKVLVIDGNTDCNHSNGFHKKKEILTPEKRDRILRPRNRPVDYMELKNKNVTSNIKTKFKRKLDRSLLMPVNVKLVSDNLKYSNPIIKLEKVDKTIKVLEARKNLEDKRKQSLEKAKNQNKIAHNRDNRCRNTLQQKVNTDEQSTTMTKNQSVGPLKTKVISIVKKVEDSQTNKQYFKCMPNNRNHNVKIKKLNVNKRAAKNECEVVVQDNLGLLNERKNTKLPKPSKGRPPLCTVVKLDKDYTCNVDYPRIRIKRHISVANSQKPQNGLSQVVSNKASVFQLSVNSVSSTGNRSNNLLRNLRNRNKYLQRSCKKKHDKKLWKNNKKKVNPANVERALEKDSSVTPNPDIKRYCEECDMSFKNKEVYLLHYCCRK